MALSPVQDPLHAALPDAHSYARIPSVLEIPNLVQSQLQSYAWFATEGLAEVYKEISPIAVYTAK